MAATKVKKAIKKKVVVAVAGSSVSLPVLAVFAAMALIAAVLAGMDGQRLEMAVGAAADSGATETGLNTYVSVAADYGVPWELIAAVAKTETAFGTVVPGEDARREPGAVFPTADPPIEVTSDGKTWAGVFLIDADVLDPAAAQTVEVSAQFIAGELIKALRAQPGWDPTVSFIEQPDVYVEALRLLPVRGVDGTVRAAVAGFATPTTTTTPPPATTAPTVVPCTVDTPTTIYADPVISAAFSGAPPAGTVTVNAPTLTAASQNPPGTDSSGVAVVITGRIAEQSRAVLLDRLASQPGTLTVVISPPPPAGDTVATFNYTQFVDQVLAGYGRNPNMRIVDLSTWFGTNVSFYNPFTGAARPAGRATLAGALTDAICGPGGPGITAPSGNPTAVDVAVPVSPRIRLRITPTYIYQVAVGWNQGEATPACAEFTPPPVTPAVVGDILHGGVPLTAEQLAVATVIAQMSASSGLDSSAVTVAVLAALTDSGLSNTNLSTLTGVFRHDPREGWATYIQLSDVAAASAVFYTYLAATPAWQQLAVTDAAAAAQHKTTPAIYAPYVTDAQRIATAASSAAGVPMQAASTQTCFGISGASAEGFVFPNTGRITSPFGPRSAPVFGSTKSHPGLDISCPTGDPILAAKTGVVARSGRRGGYGNAVEIRHDPAVTTLYGHMSVLLVSAGDQVLAGDVIGLCGSTGLSTGSHLHFEVRVDGAPIDPLLVLPAI